MNTVIENVVKPLVARVGTFVSGTLVGAGAVAGHADLVGVGASALIMIGIDLVMRKLFGPVK